MRRKNGRAKGGEVTGITESGWCRRKVSLLEEKKRKVNGGRRTNRERYSSYVIHFTMITKASVSGLSGVF